MELVYPILFKNIRFYPWCKLYFPVLFAILNKFRIDFIPLKSGHLLKDYLKKSVLCRFYLFSFLFPFGFVKREDIFLDKKRKRKQHCIYFVEPR